MTVQTGKNVIVAFKPETTFNVPAAVGAGATQFRANAAQGLALARALINSNESRADGKTTMGRLGSKDLRASYPADLSLGTFDALFEAGVRGTWSAVLTGTQADFTSVTTGANSIIAASGSFITKGYRVGDVVQLTGFPDAANNGRNLRVTSVTASTLGIAETLVINAAADTTFSIVRTKKLIQPVVPVRRSFTVDEYDQDIDQSEQGTGLRVSTIKLSAQPNGMCIVEFGFVGADLNPLGTAASPYFTTPTLTASIGLVIADATIRFAGVDVTLTAFDVTFDVRAATFPVLGSPVTPDVFDNTATVAGNVAMLRQDLLNVTRFTSETELELHVLMVEPMAEPKNFISLFIPRLKLTGVNKNFGQDGPMVETLPFTTGTKGIVAGYDDTMIALQTSAP